MTASSQQEVNKISETACPSADSSGKSCRSITFPFMFTNSPLPPSGHKAMQQSGFTRHKVQVLALGHKESSFMTLMSCDHRGDTRLVSSSSASTTQVFLALVTSPSRSHSVISPPLSPSLYLMKLLTKRRPTLDSH